MSKKTTVTRDAIVRAMTTELKPLPFVHAFWEAGAAAFNRIDEWSDIDLYILVDDAPAVAEAFRVVENALTALSPIRLTHDDPRGTGQVSRAKSTATPSSCSTKGTPSASLRSTLTH